MIHIKVKNSLFRTTLMTALVEFNPVIYEENCCPEDVLLICETQEEVNQFLLQPMTCAVVLLGAHHAEADIEMSLPCVLNELKEHLRILISKRQNAPVFENKLFLFEGAKRLLTNKKTHSQIPLTEKETELIAHLIKVFPQSATKSDLLSDVWKYNPDVESHTVETHVYALRQKMGEKYSDSFITNTSDGYLLVSDKR